MAAPRTQTTYPKICPRCGAFYQDLSSHTCPQCFAKLNLISDAEAAALIAQQELRSQDPQYAAIKTVDDEAFRVQSFGACFGTVLVVLVVLVLSVSLYFVAVKRFAGKPPLQTAAWRLSGAPAKTPAPVNFDKVVPLSLGPLKRAESDAEIALPGTLTRVYHGVYEDGVQVFAIESAGAGEDQINELQFAGAVAAQQHNPPYIQQEFATVAAQYVVIGPSATTVRSAVKSIEP